MDKIDARKLGAEGRETLRKMCIDPVKPCSGVNLEMNDT